MTHSAAKHLLAAAAFMLTSTLYGGTQTDAADTKLRSDMGHVAQLRIYLGHQSVGGNLLDGIAQLSAQTGVALRIQETSSASKVPDHTLGHTFVAENRNPIGKLLAFNQALGTQAAGLDVALLKFCYLDFEAATDAAALFSRYQTTIAGARARNPHTTIIHITTPLTTVQTGPRAFVKQLLGKAPYGILENLRREEYNDMLRKAYFGKEPVFDLARLESITPDGIKAQIEWRGQQVPVLAAAYTDDGGHLNERGQLRMARELVAILATVPVR